MKSFKNIAIILPAFLLISFKAFAQQDSAAQREELAPFVLAGYEILDYKYSDVNGDKLEDAILVLKRQGEPQPNMYEADNTLLEDWPLKRPLLILVRQKDGFLKEVARNDNIVMCAHCGGVFGDPFEGIEIDRNTFTILHYGGSAWRWREDYTFQYDAKSQKWFLYKTLSLSYHDASPNKTMKRKVKTQKQFGKIAFEDVNNEYE